MNDHASKKGWRPRIIQRMDWSKKLRDNQQSKLFPGQHQMIFWKVCSSLSRKLIKKSITLITQDARQVTVVPSDLPSLYPHKGSEFFKPYLPTCQEVFPKGIMSEPSISPETMPLLQLHFQISFKVVSFLSQITAKNLSAISGQILPATFSKAGPNWPASAHFYIHLKLQGALQLATCCTIVKSEKHKK